MESALCSLEILQDLQYFSLRRDRSHDEPTIQSGSSASPAYTDASRQALRLIATLPVSAGEGPTPSYPGTGAVGYQGPWSSPDPPTRARDHDNQRSFGPLSASSAAFRTRLSWFRSLTLGANQSGRPDVAITRSARSRSALDRSSALGAGHVSGSELVVAHGPSKTQGRSEPFGFPRRYDEGDCRLTGEIPFSARALV